MIINRIKRDETLSFEVFHDIKWFLHLIIMKCCHITQFLRSKIILYPDVIILPELHPTTNKSSCLARMFMDAIRINESRAYLSQNLPEVSNSSQSSSDYEIFPFSLSPRLKLKWVCLINGATQRHLTINIRTSPHFII